MFAPVFALALTGCASHHTKPADDGPSRADGYTAIMQQAAARYDAHDYAQAKNLYQQAADINPTRAEPWYQMARISFNGQNYGRAIISAEEALKRDPSQTEAQSILTIAGLRVAIEALGRLHEDVELQGPAHAEAEKLADKMRDVLGQDVLVPPQQKAVRHPRRHRAPRPVARKKPAPKRKAPAKKAPEPTSNNPFQSLSGGL